MLIAKVVVYIGCFGSAEEGYLILALEWSQYSQHFVGGVAIKRFPYSLRILIYLEGILTSYSFGTEQEVIKNISP